MIKIEDMSRDEFKDLLFNAYRMELDDDLDINHACLIIRTAVNQLLTLLRFPEMRPLQEKYNLMVNSGLPTLIPPSKKLEEL